MNNENIKEAIAKYVESKELVLMAYPPDYIEDVKTDIEVAFRKGAEWMAGRFQKIEGDLVDWYETGNVEYCSGIRTHESFKVPSGFYIKKEE